MKINKKFCLLTAAIIIFGLIIISCAVNSRFVRYLVPGDYFADPSARVFNGRLYIYPSHDRNSGNAENEAGDHFDMVDYHVFSMDDVEKGEVVSHGKVLDLKDIPWATRQLWDNDVTHKNGKYYMYFPAKDKEYNFRIGVAIADKPEGPFIPEPQPMAGSYSIDPCVFEDDDGSYYMYFGGIWGGQLQNYNNNNVRQSATIPGSSSPAIAPRMAKLSDDMLQFAETVRPVTLLEKNGNPITQGASSRRFFEAAWMHKYKGVYYFSYSTGDTHLICYATGDNPYGPFTYQGVILSPVIGWTTHHSIVEFKDRWYLFFHDSRPSGGITNLRSIKVTELFYEPDGSIKTISGGGSL